MSMKNNYNQHLKQCIREQQTEIDILKRDEKKMRELIRSMRENKLATYSYVMRVILESYTMEDLTEEQAGQLMLTLTDIMLHSNE